MPEAQSRTEYRVVEDGDGGISVFGRYVAVDRSEADAALRRRRKHGHPDARLQQRTVIEHPWEDVQGGE